MSWRSSLPSSCARVSATIAFAAAGETSSSELMPSTIVVSAPAGSSAMPNFWSSCAVEMNSCPPAWMPVVTRSMTRARLPRRRAIVAMRAGSSGSSITIFAKPSVIASSISASDLLLPCSTRRRPGTPAASAMRISPIVQVST